MCGLAPDADRVKYCMRTTEGTLASSTDARWGNQVSCADKLRAQASSDGTRTGYSEMLLASAVGLR
jgi:hypothetical protein